MRNNTNTHTSNKKTHSSLTQKPKTRKLIFPAVSSAGIEIFAFPPHPVGALCNAATIISGTAIFPTVLINAFNVIVESYHPCPWYLSTQLNSSRYARYVKQIRAQGVFFVAAEGTTNTIPVPGTSYRSHCMILQHAV